MKKKVIIVSVVLAVLLTVAGVAWYFIPRLVLKNVYGIDPKQCKAAKQITDFDNTWSDSMTVGTDYYVIDIPKGLTAENVNISNSKRYHSADKSKDILLIGAPSQGDDINLMNPKYHSNTDEFSGATREELEKVFNSLDYGLPDSCYNTLKCAAMLDVKDFNMLDANNVLAFRTYAILKTGLSNYTHIYEKDDVRALVYNTGAGSTSYYIEVYHKDNLNESYSMRVVTDDEEDITKILNSFVFLKK